MMTFRYHIVTIVSVFLALAIGIAIGGGPLKGEVDNSLVTQVENDRRTIAALEGQIAGAETAGEFNDAVATTLAPRVLRDQLAGHGVAVVSLPGADPATVAALGERVTDAGGEVVGNYRIAAGLLDAEQQPLVEDLAGRLVGEAPDLAPLADASGYEQAGALVARAIATAEDTPAEVDGPASAILAGLSTAGLFTADGTPTARGDLVLVVAGPTVMENLPDGAGAGLAALADAVSEGAAGVVVAGPTRAARPDGLLAAARRDLRTSTRVATVDSAHLVAGQLVAILTLAGTLAGQVGHYGAVDATDGAAPGE